MATQVTLGGTTLVAHLTPGHTKGCTTWTMKATENGRTYDVVIIGSVGVNPGFSTREQQGQSRHRRGVHPRIQGAAIAAVRHSAGIASGHVQPRREVQENGTNPNPFIDPAGYKAELDTVETVFTRTLDEQRKAATK